MPGDCIMSKGAFWGRSFDQTHNNALAKKYPAAGSFPLLSCELKIIPCCFQRFEVGCSPAHLRACSRTKGLQLPATRLGPRPNRVCMFHPRSAWNPPPSGRLVTSLSNHSSPWFGVFCHISHNKIRDGRAEVDFLKLLLKSVWKYWIF